MSVNKVQLANGETIIDISDSTVTPETLAEGVTAHDASGKKITGKMVPGGGSSVQSDWNQTDSSAADFIKNKPFGEVYGDTLTVEQINMETLDPSTLVGDLFLKVCDTAITMDDLSNGYTVKTASGVSEVPPEAVGETAMQIVDGTLMFGDAFLSVEERAVGVDIEGLIFPESGLYIGVYFLSESGVLLTIPGFGKFEGIQKLDEKYIPAHYKNVQSDWNQTNESAGDFIKNKPEIGRNVFYVNQINGVNRIASTGDGSAITHEEMAEMMNDSAKIMMVSYNGVFHYPKMFSVGRSMDGIKFGFIVVDYCDMYKDPSTQKILYRDKTLRAYTAEIPDEYIST